MSVSFAARHIGPDHTELTAMAEACGYANADALVDAAIPSKVRAEHDIDVASGISEHAALAELGKMSDRNDVYRSFIGMGYYNTITPPVIRRLILENPGWYTPYTPYQAEIAQGRMEALFLFQTLVADLTSLPIAGASLLDEATAAAEALQACLASHRGKRTEIFVDHQAHPQTIAVVQTRMAPLNVHVVCGDAATFVPDETYAAALLSYPSSDGGVVDYRGLVTQCQQAGVRTVIASDLLALTLLEAPGHWGADACIGSAQRLGVPLGFGGPHAGFLAVADSLKRQLPGRLVGLSKDRRDQPAYRLALQTREQHIRREKATSNICTAQALLANIASAYAVYHGPEGLTAIAQKMHSYACLLAAGLRRLGVQVAHDVFFETVRVDLRKRSVDELLECAESHGINLRALDSQTIVIALDETVERDTIRELLEIFNGDRELDFSLNALEKEAESPLGAHALKRTTAFCTDPQFSQHRSETKLMRWLKLLENRDLSLTHRMIPLGSCTMKLNPAAAMLPMLWPAWSNVHPFVPRQQARGYHILFQQLEQWLAEVTGFAGVSLQPNAGSQGEYAGLLAIQGYHSSRGQGHRNMCLIPQSAHGTNPASAVMAGMKVIPVGCYDNGDIDLDDLRHKASEHAENLAALMITWPSTHGVFEDTIAEVSEIIHSHGGQVYLDGANMNAQVGFCRPGDLGADVCHLNLHKTFAIPHGGGGPGVGPIGVARHLVPFLPGHPVVNIADERRTGAVSAAPWGSALICTISWMYIRMMGGDGLKAATAAAIVNANYMAHRLKDTFPILYTGHDGLVAHECIIDLRPYKAAAGVTEEDIAKRLIDYGFHAPTVSWPVPGTMMIEPTESEDRSELDRFCDAMIAIKAEVDAVAAGTVPVDLFKNAPHPAVEACADAWPHAYAREKACYPMAVQVADKFWPGVARINNAYGDRNLVCACSGFDAVEEET